MIEPEKNLKEMTSLLKDARFKNGRTLYLDGSGSFIDKAGSYVSPFDVLKQIYQTQHLIERIESYCSTLIITADFINKTS